MIRNLHDNYLLWAARIHGVSPDKVTPGQRHAVKKAAFTVIYKWRAKTASDEELFTEVCRNLGVDAAACPLPMPRSGS